MPSAELIALGAVTVALVVEEIRLRRIRRRQGEKLQNAYVVVRDRNEQLTQAADEMGRLYRNQLLTSRKQSARLKKVLETATSIGSDLALDKVLHQIVHAVQDAVGFKIVLLRVLDERTELFEARAFAGLDRQAIDKLERRGVPRAEFESWLKDEFRVSRSYFISHKANFWPVPGSEYEGFTPDLGERKEGEWHQDDVLFVPLLHRDGAVLGYLSLDDPADRRVPSREVIETAEILAAHAVVALQNASLYEQIGESMRQLEEATQRGEELNDLKSSFVQIVSHELLTPLTVIRSHVEALQEHVGGMNPKTQHEFLQAVDENSLKLHRLIQSILELTQLESGRFRMQREPMNVPELIDETIGLLRDAADEKGIVLGSEPVRRDLIVEADRNLVRRVLLNLGTNAIKFTPKGGRVTFRAQLNERSVKLTVEDNGIGIPAEELTKVFEKFHQVDDSLSRKYPGVGLGLFVAKSIVEWHGGEITAESEPGRGSRFVVALPATPGDASVITHSATPSRSVSEHLTRLTVEMVAEIMNARIASLMLVDEERDELYIKAARGLREEVVCGTRVKMGNSIAGWVAQHGTPLLVTNVEEDARFGSRENSHQYETKSLLSVPVKVDGRVVGVININNKISMTPFTEDDKALLSSLSERVGRAWRHASEHDETADRVEQASRALAAIIDNARRSRLKLTSGSMATRATAVARRVGMGEDEIQAIAFVASIHDVGMAHIGPPVLHEPGKLDPETWAQVAQHPARTVEILKPIEFEERVTECILTHHERMDGRGYPRGLAGDLIPLGARIIAVVDAYESMTSGRPYRQAMPQAEAIRELRRCSGSQFDPKIVEAFCQVLAAEETTKLVRAPEAA
ncbi:MAG TPA: HD domain-containing phosphohydrolase [Candidatus Eisenbacteria bacterium]|nr:HD domain-containing phosphohydrolase [Candidatus Eisenbacteria bacterium]